ncbi:hypothetical protein [Synechococcus phage Yong-M3-232]|nr:hypothetical protein [Synechococcus phage Yong-M3-232]
MLDINKALWRASGVMLLLNIPVWLAVWFANQ